MRERTYKTKDGKILFFSPKAGYAWAARFGMQVRGEVHGQVTLTATQARHVAGELLTRADHLDSLKSSKGDSTP